MMKRTVILFSLLLTFVVPQVALAQSEVVNNGLTAAAIASTLLYGVIGIFLCIVGYFAFDRIARLDLQKELVEDQNIALGIMLAGVFIGLAIIISAAITG